MCHVYARSPSVKCKWGCTADDSIAAGVAAAGVAVAATSSTPNQHGKRTLSSASDADKRMKLEHTSASSSSSSRAAATALTAAAASSSASVLSFPASRWSSHVAHECPRRLVRCEVCSTEYVAATKIAHDASPTHERDVYKKKYEETQQESQAWRTTANRWQEKYQQEQAEKAELTRRIRWLERDNDQLRGSVSSSVAASPARPASSSSAASSSVTPRSAVQSTPTRVLPHRSAAIGRGDPMETDEDREAHAASEQENAAEGRTNPKKKESRRVSTSKAHPVVPYNDFAQVPESIVWDGHTLQIYKLDGVSCTHIYTIVSASVTLLRLSLD
jgi:hypothetical protein